MNLDSKPIDLGDYLEYIMQYIKILFFTNGIYRCQDNK